jgi:hypothetical protein
VRIRGPAYSRLRFTSSEANPVISGRVRRARETPPRGSAFFCDLPRGMSFRATSQC